MRTPNSLNLRRAGGRVEFTLTGSNYRDIAAAADDFLNVLRERALELDDLEIEFQQTQPQLSLTVDRRRTDDLGIPIEGIVNTLRAMVDGFEVAELNVRRPVCAGPLGIDGRCDRRSKRSQEPVRAGSGRHAGSAFFVRQPYRGRRGGRTRSCRPKRAIEIEASLPQGYAMQAAVDRIEALASETLPPSIGLHFINEAATLKDTSNEVAITFAIAVLVVLLVLAAQFESILSALVVILTVPFGLAAAVFSLKHRHIDQYL